MASIHVRISKVFSFHEPQLRNAAFRLQDATHEMGLLQPKGCVPIRSRFMASIHVQFLEVFSFHASTMNRAGLGPTRQRLGER